MKATVNKDLCIGCGACTGVCPDVFTFDDDGKAIASGEVTADNKAAAQEAADGCPVQAITVED